MYIVFLCNTIGVNLGQPSIAFQYYMGVNIFIYISVKDDIFMNQFLLTKTWCSDLIDCHCWILLLYEFVQYFNIAKYKSTKRR